jgi:L-ascorbate metabolism protein UlaG (beta-lactamase superfamily)
LVGPKRFRPLPIQINQIPRIDAVLVSHEHLDHLDSSSVKDLNARFSRTGIKWFVGLGLAKWFKSNGITKDVHELGWWQSIRFDNLELVFTPTQHWSGLIDKNKVYISI